MLRNVLYGFMQSLSNLGDRKLASIKTIDRGYFRARIAECQITNHACAPCLRRSGFAQAGVALQRRRHESRITIHDLIAECGLRNTKIAKQGLKESGKNTLHNFVAFFTAIVVLFTATLQREESA